MPNSKIYDSGVPCKRKHRGVRYALSHDCVECAAIRSKAANAKIRKRKIDQKIAADKAAWRALAIGARPKGIRLRRETVIKIQTPPWADKATLAMIYACCPPGYEVDHIVPLHGRYVSGLHIPLNLQYLTKSENRRKQAKFVG